MMNLAQVRISALNCLLIAVLIGCGSETSSEDAASSSSSNFVNSPSNNDIDAVFEPRMIDFTYQPKYLFSRWDYGQIVEEQMLNGSGDILFPQKQVIERGNLKIAVANIVDPDGIGRVLLGFNQAERAMVVCEQYCPSPFSFYQTGINPFNFNQTPGNITLQVWVEDLNGNLTAIDSQQVNWIPQSVVIGSSQRTESGEVTLSWHKLDKALRYNVYLSSMLISDVRLIDSLPDSQKAIALTATDWMFSELEPRKSYYAKVTAVDGSGESAFSENVLLTATDIVLPLAVSDTFSGLKRQPLSGNVLENDQDFGLGPLTVQTPALVQPKNGDLALFSDGSFTYSPRNGFFGNDTFVYIVTNIQGATAQAVVNLVIVKDNQAPIAISNNYATAIDSLLEVTGLGLLGNDIDFDGDDISINTIPIKNVQNGILTLNNDGSFSYLPNNGFVGEDSFEYEVRDGKGGISSANVSIKVERILTNIPPVAFNDSFETSEDMMLNAQSPGILVNDYDGVIGTGNVVTDPSLYSQISILQPSENGTTILTEEGAFQYIPNENFYGQDAFVYEITDLDGETAKALVLLTINSVNDAPVAMDDFSQVVKGESVVIGVLNNDLDIDGTLDFQSVNIVDEPKSGKVSVDRSTGQITYQNNANYSGDDHFVYSVRDNEGAESNTAFVNISVTEENAGPTASSFGVETVQDQGVEIDISENVSDPDGINFSSLKILSGPSHGVLSINAINTVVTYTPESGFHGLDQFNYTVEDTHGSVSNIATVAISVTTSNAAPVAVNDIVEVKVGSAVTIDVLQNDFDDLALNPSTVEIVSEPNFGSVVVQSDGTVTYTHTALSIGPDVFTYQVQDSDGISSNIALVSINVVAPKSELTLNNHHSQWWRQSVRRFMQ
jgi:hypothetical protein